MLPKLLVVWGASYSGTLLVSPYLDAYEPLRGIRVEPGHSRPGDFDGKPTNLSTPIQI